MKRPDKLIAAQPDVIGKYIKHLEQRLEQLTKDKNKTDLKNIELRAGRK